MNYPAIQMEQTRVAVQADLAEVIITAMHRDMAEAMGMAYPIKNRCTLNIFKFPIAYDAA